MMEAKRNAILTIFRNNAMVSTPQVARIFNNAQPLKRASAALVELGKEKIIDGYYRGVAGEPKIWRLTKKGREMLDVKSNSISLKSRNANHYLSITDIWQRFNDIGTINKWVFELRERIIGSEHKYCADAFIDVKTESGRHICLIESQISEITSNRWAEKWARLSEFMESESWKMASFQTFKNKAKEHVILKPSQIKIIVISKQQPSTISTGTSIPLLIFREANQIQL